jgi:pimeloyl-ACP methyl ester carboxylesterase
MAHKVRSRRIRTGTLEVAYEEGGEPEGMPVLLLHGFPYDARAYDEVVPPLAAAGMRVIVPWLRGYGATRFLSPATPRSGQQAALAQDLRELMDALAVEKAILAGYDWGGRAACIAAALWPERVLGLVTANGYNIQDIAAAAKPAPPEQEWRYWYQYYFHTERGRAGLAENRRALCRLLWQLWSPRWRFDEAAYERSAAAFDNPDFVAVVIHSYRHRYGYAPGDPALEPIEAALAAQPRIGVPTVALWGADDGVTPSEGAEKHARFFTGPYRHRILPGIGHNIPQEDPQAVSEAVLALAASPAISAKA